MKKQLTLALMLASAFLTVHMAAAQESQPIMFHSGAVSPEANLDAFIQAPAPSIADRFNGTYYRYLQFFALPDEAQKARIEASGIRLLYYMPYNTFMAAIPANYDKSALRQFNIRSVVRQDDLQKLHTALLGDLPEYAKVEKGTIDVYIQYQADVPPATALAEASRLGTVLRDQGANHTLTVRVPESSLRSIASLPWVSFIEAVAPPSVPDDFKGRSLHRSNAINTGWYMGRHYNGSGVAAALADDGPVGPHIDFQGRLHDHVTPGGNGSHGDMTSGILAGAGNLNPVYQGMADGVDLHVFRIDAYPQIVDAVSNNATYGTVVSSTSYSQGCNQYTTDSQFGDQTIRDNPQLIFVFSAGNNQGGNCQYGAGAGWGVITGGYKQGKNVLTCANLDALEVLDNSSSRGPASDGRIKPDISANGKDQMSTAQNNNYQVGGGTSAACPGIAGICTQLIQAYKELNSATDAPTALIKACLLNGAEDIGNPGPDYTYGYGRVNALRAVQTLEDGRYLLDSLSQGGTNTHMISVPANVSELRVMVYWPDEGGVPLSSVSLVNDLDMTVTDPSNASWNPWVLDPTPVVALLTAPATRKPDHLNNMEQVTLANPAAGNYAVAITGNSVPAGPQEYYLVYEFRTDAITVTYPMGGEGFVPSQQEVIRWDALKGMGNFDLDYSTDGGTTWTTIATNINQNTLQYTWNVPATLTGEARVRVTRGGVSGMSAENFAIIGLPTGITVDWACPDSVRLTWNAVTGAAWYEVSMLGATHMDSVGTSATTNFVVTGTNPVDPFWFSVRAVHANGSKGRRANAVNKGPGTFNCPLAFDVRLNKILSPTGGSALDCQDLDSITVAVEIENRGLNDVWDIPIKYRLNNGTVFSELYTDTLVPFQIDFHTFSTMVDFSTAGAYVLDAWIDFPGDQNTFNDSASATTNVVAGTLAALPFTEDFESFSLCSEVFDCEQITCTPGNGFINETNLSEDDIDWRTDEGGTPSANTGPSVDHTLGTAAGNYMYLEASNGCNAKVALLLTPCIDLTAAYAPELSFWYHMYGADMGSLHVDVQSNGVWNLDVMPVLAGNKGNNWLQANVNLANYAGEIITVRFRGITGNNFASDMAIDDIGIVETSAPPVAQFVGNPTQACIGKTVVFTDQSLNVPSSWQWTFTPSTVIYVNGTSSTSQDPEVQFTASGSYDVELSVMNPFGNSSTTKNAYIAINSAAAIPLVEDFQSGTFPPAGWSVVDPGGTVTWAEAAGITGPSGNPTNSAWMDNYFYNNIGAEDELVTFEYDLTTANTPEMTFDVAYARYSAQYSDALRIDVSTDCGVTFVPSGYLKDGTTLATAPDQTAQWLPSAAGDWRNDMVDLTPWVGSTVVIRFVNINGYGNSLLIDNVNIHEPTGINEPGSQAGISVYPNPGHGLYFLSVASPALTDYALQVHDMNGRIVLDKVVHLSGASPAALDLSAYPKGVYSLSLQSDNKVFQTRLVIL